MRILAIFILLICGYYTFLIGILVKLLAKANFAYFLL